jgi:hypothetical protein
MIRKTILYYNSKVSSVRELKGHYTHSATLERAGATISAKRSLFSRKKFNYLNLLFDKGPKKMQ